MNSETLEITKANDLSFEEAEQLQEVMAETGLHADEALEILEEV